MGTHSFVDTIELVVLGARARPCAARTRLFGLIATPNGQNFIRIYHMAHFITSSVLDPGSSVFF
jgi:hypothetical protein